jgi:hypothetical protein
MGPKAKKKRKAKKKTPLEKIEGLLAKLEALHDKENAIVEQITDVIDEAKFDNE